MMILNSICAGYGTKEVLHNLSLTVQSGELIALLGPNGSGKSTLLKVMAGQQVPSVGTVHLEERRLLDIPPKQRGRHIAYFPQSRPMPDMDVRTLVAHGRFPRLGFGRVMRECDRMAVHNAIHQTGLAGFERRPLASLSGGERQRAYLAMLIAQEADILLLDEPGSFLDIRHQLEVMEILQALNREGKTVLFAAHDLPLAFSSASRILLLESGRLAGDATPEHMAIGGEVERVFGVRVRRQDEALFSYTLVSKG